MPDMLKIEGLTCILDGRAVVKDLSFSVAAGQVVCLLGPSGCGKSTTLRLIAGLEDPNAGSIMIKTQFVWSNKTSVPPEKRGVGYLFQEYALFPHLSVRENIAFGLSQLGSKERRARVQEIIDQVGLQDLADRRTQTLSGGEQQRVALARALAPRPAIMLLDEPFSSLDPQLRHEMRRLTANSLAQQNMATVLVTHDAEDALALADILLVMEEGKILQIGEPNEIFSHPMNTNVARIFGPINLLDRAQASAVFENQVLWPDGQARLGVRPQHVFLDLARHGEGIQFTGHLSILRHLAGLYLCELKLAPDVCWQVVLPDDATPEEGEYPFYIPQSRVIYFTS